MATAPFFIFSNCCGYIIYVHQTSGQRRTIVNCPFGCIYTPLESYDRLLHLWTRRFANLEVVGTRIQRLKRAM